MSISRRGTRDVLLHQIDEIGASGDEFRSRVLRDLADGIADVARLDIIEVDHGADLRWSSLHDLLDGRDDVRVAAAAADIAAHQFANFVGGLGVALGNKPDGRADLPRRAIAALKAVMGDEGLLQGVELAVRWPVLRWS